MDVQVLDVDDLMRLLYRNLIPNGSTRILLQSTTVDFQSHRFHTDVSIIESAIAKRLLVPVEDGASGYYEITNDEFVLDAWDGRETARISAAKDVLTTLHPDKAKEFKYQRYRVLLHPMNPAHGRRGFVFNDTAGNEYLVTAGGDVVHILATVSF